MNVEVAYAKPDVQMILRIEVIEGASAETAIRASGILERFPEIDLRHNKIGIFGKPCGLEQALRPGDRVEIYRPLIADPKEARRSRAVKNNTERIRRPHTLRWYRFRECWNSDVPPGFSANGRRLGAQGCR